MQRLRAHKHFAALIVSMHHAWRWSRRPFALPVAIKDAGTGDTSAAVPSTSSEGAGLALATRLHQNHTSTRRFQLLPAGLFHQLLTQPSSLTSRALHQAAPKAAAATTGDAAGDHFPAAALNKALDAVFPHSTLSTPRDQALHFISELLLSASAISSGGCTAQPREVQQVMAISRIGEALAKQPFYGRCKGQLSSLLASCKLFKVTPGRSGNHSVALDAGALMLQASQKQAAGAGHKTEPSDSSQETAAITTTTEPEPAQTTAIHTATGGACSKRALDAVWPQGPLASGNEQALRFIAEMLLQRTEGDPAAAPSMPLHDIGAALSQQPFHSQRTGSLTRLLQDSPFFQLPTTQGKPLVTLNVEALHQAAAAAAQTSTLAPDTSDGPPTHTLLSDALDAVLPPGTLTNPRQTALRFIADLHLSAPTVGSNEGAAQRSGVGYTMQISQIGSALSQQPFYSNLEGQLSSLLSSRNLFKVTPGCSGSHSVALDKDALMLQALPAARQQPAGAGDNTEPTAAAAAAATKTARGPEPVQTTASHTASGGACSKRVLDAVWPQGSLMSGNEQALRFIAQTLLQRAEGDPAAAPSMPLYDIGTALSQQPFHSQRTGKLTQLLQDSPFFQLPTTQGNPLVTLNVEALKQSAAAAAVTSDTSTPGDLVVTDSTQAHLADALASVLPHSAQPTSEERALRFIAELLLAAPPMPGRPAHALLKSEVGGALSKKWADRQDRGGHLGTLLASSELFRIVVLADRGSDDLVVLDTEVLLQAAQPRQSAGAASEEGSLQAQPVATSAPVPCSGGGQLFRQQAAVVDAVWPKGEQAPANDQALRFVAEMLLARAEGDPAAALSMPLHDIGTALSRQPFHSQRTGKLTQLLQDSPFFQLPTTQGNPLVTLNVEALKQSAAAAACKSAPAPDAADGAPTSKRLSKALEAVLPSRALTTPKNQALRFLAELLLSVPAKEGSAGQGRVGHAMRFSEVGIALSKQPFNSQLKGNLHSLLASSGLFKVTKLKGQSGNGLVVLDTDTLLQAARRQEAGESGRAASEPAGAMGLGSGAETKSPEHAATATLRAEGRHLSDAVGGPLPDARVGALTQPHLSKALDAVLPFGALATPREQALRFIGQQLLSAPAAGGVGSVGDISHAMQLSSLQAALSGQLFRSSLKGGLGELLASSDLFKVTVSLDTQALLRAARRRSEGASSGAASEPAGPAAARAVSPDDRRLLDAVWPQGPEASASRQALRFAAEMLLARAAGDPAAAPSALLKDIGKALSQQPFYKGRTYSLNRLLHRSPFFQLPTSTGNPVVTLDVAALRQAAPLLTHRGAPAPDASDAIPPQKRGSEVLSTVSSSGPLSTSREQNLQKPAEEQRPAGAVNVVTSHAASKLLDAVWPQGLLVSANEQALRFTAEMLLARAKGGSAAPTAPLNDVGAALATQPFRRLMTQKVKTLLHSSRFFRVTKQECRSPVVTLSMQTLQAVAAPGSGADSLGATVQGRHSQSLGGVSAARGGAQVAASAVKGQHARDGIGGTQGEGVPSTVEQAFEPVQHSLLKPAPMTALGDGDVSIPLPSSVLGVQSLAVRRRQLGEVTQADVQWLIGEVAEDTSQMHLGFDTEFCVTGLALIQLGNADRVLLIQVPVAEAIDASQRPSVPQSLADLLSSPTILKAAAGAKDDATRVAQSLGVAMGGVVCLTRLHAGMGQTSHPGLFQMLNHMLPGTGLKKGKSSDWSVQRLSDGQVAYASIDAFVSWAVATASDVFPKAPGIPKVSTV